MKEQFKKIIMSQLVFSLFVFSLLAFVGNSGNRFVNKPWEKLNEGEKNLNKIYLNEKIINYSEKEKLSFLLSLLDEQKTCFLPREALINLGESVKEPLRKIVGDQTRPMTTRSESLFILAELNDQEAIPIIERDPILIKPISAYEEIHAPEIVTFQKSYLVLKSAGAEPSEKIEILINMLKEQKCDYLVRKELIELGEKATPSLVGLLSDKKNLYLTRLNALFALKEIGDEKSRSAVMGVLQDDKETNQMHDLAAETLRIISKKTEK